MTCKVNFTQPLVSEVGGTECDSALRLFERALAVAWRMAEEVVSRPLAQRFGPDYTAQIQRLEYRTSVLWVRDANIAGRAQALLNATRAA